MSRFRIVRGLLLTGGSSNLPVIFDNRFGTDTVTAAATGWFTFDLNAGNTRYYVNSKVGGPGSDSNNGLSAATPKLTLDAGLALLKAGTAGDQLMVAGGEGQTYLDTNQHSLNARPGLSIVYPTVIQCYDSTDPTNASKYGKLRGSNQPKVTTCNQATFTGYIDNGAGASGATLTVTAMGAGSGPIYVNMNLHGVGVPQYCQILSQLSGTPGGVGTYHLAVSSLTPSTTMFGQAGTSWDIANNAGQNNYATQGLTIVAAGFDTIGPPTDAGITFTNPHSNISFQNCRFRGLGPVSNANGTVASVWNISKCSFVGMWQADRGDASGLYSQDNDQFILEDCVFVHCGYQLGMSRDNSTTNGGANVYGHSCYFHTNPNVNITERRIIFMDSESDDWGCRPNGTLNQLVSIDQAAGQCLTGYSQHFYEAPLGTTATVEDFICTGGQNTWSSHLTYGGGFGASNTQPSGTSARRGYLFDNPYKANSTLVAVVAQGTDGAYTQGNQHIDVSELRVYNYATSQSYNYYDTAVNTCSATFSNNLVDSLTVLAKAQPGPAPLSGSNRVWTLADYPAPITKNGLISGLGFSTKADLANAVLAYPDLPWPQAALQLAQNAFGGVLTWATAAVPSLTGLPSPEIIYKNTLSDLTLRSTFVRAAVPTISSATVSADKDSTGAATCVITTATAHGLSTGQMVQPTGFTPSQYNTQGPVQINVISPTQFSFVNPRAPTGSATVIGTYQQGTVLLGAGANSTFASAGATGTGASDLPAGFTLVGTSNTLLYDGSGSGAFPTFHITETNTDGAGTHTTAFSI